MSIALVGSFRSKSPIVRASTSLAFACGVALVTGAASAQSFTGLGVLPGGGIESKSRCVSDNGSVVVGFGLIPPDNSTPTTGYRAFRWTGGVMTNLETLGGGPYWYSSSRGVSADGSVVVGGSSFASGERAFRWTAAGSMVSLGTLPQNTSSHAHDVSSNGLVVVGVSTHPSNGDRAFRWTGGVMTNLGTLKHGTYSEAWAVSGNGSVVAGIGDTRSGDRAFRWTSSGMQDLGPAVSRNTSKGDISGDGLVVVGATGSASSPVTSDRAFRWSAGTGMVSLSTLQAGWGSWATGVNQNGSMIVGSSGFESHPANTRRLSSGPPPSAWWTSTPICPR
jgi:probable HAF family extracellular repeat protein